MENHDNYGLEAKQAHLINRLLKWKSGFSIEIKNLMR